MFKSKSLKFKILASFLVICLGLGMVAFKGFYALHAVVDEYDKLAKISVPNLGHISGMRARGRQIHTESIKLALYHDQPEETKRTLESLNKGRNRYEEITKEKLATPFVDGEKEVFDRVEAKYAFVKQSTEKILAIFASADPDRISKMKSELMKFENYVIDHQASLLELDDFHVAAGEKWSAEAARLSKAMRWTLMVVAFITLGAAVWIALYMSSNINKILLDVTERLKVSAQKVTLNSEKVAHASESLTEGIGRQAEALHETVASTDEIAAMTEKTSDNSRESLNRAELSQDASVQSQRSLNEMLHAIEQIGDSTHAINDQIKKGNTEIQEVVDLIFEIEKKTKLIDEIVFQTKLLSFNVSVEAARAGEHGKGFAVVAVEMANLAELSGRASKEISTMLSHTTKKALNVVENNKTTVETLMCSADEKVVLGVNVAKDCKTSLDKIISYVDEMCSMIRENTVSSIEQAKGVSEINRAMSQIDSVTAQNTHSSKECSQAASELRLEVERNMRIISDLLEVVHGRVEALAEVKDGDFSKPRSQSKEDVAA